MRRSPLKPYTQGKLDSLCGPYAVVNAIHYLCGPLQREEAVSLLISILHQLRGNYDPVNRLEEGTGVMEMRWLMKSVCRDYPIRSKRSLLRNRERGDRTLWEEIECFLRETSGVVLIDFECVDHGHWTLIRAISANTLTLFDSNGRQYLRRRSCATVGEKVERPYTFHPSTAYFLYSEEKGAKGGPL